MAGKPRKKRVPVDPNESKGAKFKRLGSNRITKATKAIAAVGGLASRSYEYSEAQAQFLIDTLKASVKGVEARFSAPEASSGSGSIAIPD